MHMNERRTWLSRAVVIAAVSSLAIVSCRLTRPPAKIPRISGGEVHGLVFTELAVHAPGASARRIMLPDITVFLRDVNGNIASPKVTSNLDGRYFIPRRSPGTYSVCWETPGFITGCNPTSVFVVGGNAYATPSRVSTGEGVVFGRVLLNDGSPCRFSDPFFGVDLVTKMEMSDNTGHLLATVRANNQGEYVFPSVLEPRVKVRAICEKSIVSRSATRNSIADITYPNSRPVVSQVVTFDTAGNGVRVSSPGATLQVRSLIKDPNSDPLTYRWKPTAAGSGLVTSTTAQTAWPMPPHGGLHSMYVLASDGKGGYARGRVDITSDGKGVLFTGTVIDAGTRAPIPHAEVSVNNVSVTTNAAGFFTLYVQTESSRYVINVAKDGYEFLSKVTTEGVVGQTYRLHRAFVATVDPTRDETVTEHSESRQRTQVVIPAGSLVDRNGTAASGSLRLTLSTIDLRDPFGRWPGDGSGITRSGQDAVLTPYGTVHIDVRDASGQPYNLRPGTTATVRVSVDPVQAAAGPLPPSMPAWTYDRSTGIWKEDGEFRLVGNVYEAKVRHFSELNVDVQKTGPAACVRVHTDATVTIPYNLRITVPATGSTAAKTVTKVVDNPLSAILQLPPSTAGIQLDIIDTNGNVVATPGGTQTFTSPSGINDHFPPFPFDACGAPGTADVTIALTTPPPPGGGFLTYLGEDDATSADAYYAAIDPTSAKTTLASWKTANGFGNSGAGEIEANAAYLNALDLGLGRFMNVHKKANGDLAYFVSNYGLPPNLGSADFAAAAKLGGDPADHLIATVAMEFTAAPSGGARYTKFYVFNAAGSRVNAADLDGNGAKFIPSLCSTCHGGDFPGNHYDSTTHTWDANGNLNTRFIAFDVESFGYSGLASTVTKAGQQKDFNTLNSIVLDTNYSGATDELVHGWYGVTPGTAIPAAATFDETFVPTGWRTNAGTVALYNQVVKTSCRACHATRDAGLDWNTYTVLHDNLSVKSVVCNLHVMPQAQVTFRNFWLSTTPNRPAALANGGLSSFAASPTCP